MSLQLPPSSFALLNQLVTTYNSTPDNEPIQRLFYLQKINAELNKTKLDAELFEWLYKEEPTSWNAQLLVHGINPDGSIILKGFQFAQAVARHAPAINTAPHCENEYAAMRERDVLLKADSFADIREPYIFNCQQLNKVSRQDAHTAALIERQTKVLSLAKAKFDAIRQRKTEPLADLLPHQYKTIELTQGNNFNFKFTMTGSEHPFVFRVEDREELGLDQDLYSYPVSKHFIEDFGCFMWGFEDKQNNDIVYKPVFLSQFAKQGNLREIAKSLKGTNPKHYAGIISHYFSQLTDLCKGLIDAGVYHPDIKLTNFLVHGNRILISDRKTLIRAASARANELRSTPAYAPQEYLECITPQMTFNFKSFTRIINLPQFMAYQLGMALKEFITLTQRDEIEPEKFNDPNHSITAYFNTPEKAIANLSTLIQELTREDATKRMSIRQMQELFKYRNHPPQAFNKEVERVLPASTLGIQDDVTEVNTLIQSPLKGTALIKAANIVFKKRSESEHQEPRLTQLVGQLAEKCFKEGSLAYFSKISNAIETALLNEDWDNAPFYRKVLHVLSFGLYRVPRNSSVNSIEIDVNFQSEAFQTHFFQLEYTSSSVINNLGKRQADNFKSFIFNNLDKIAPQDIEPEEHSIEEDAAHQEEQPVKTTNAETSIENVDERHSSMICHNAEDDAEVDSGSVVINTVASAEEQSDIVEKTVISKGLTKNILFFASRKKQLKDKKFGTYKSTLFRGEVSQNNIPTTDLNSETIQTMRP